MVNGPSHMPILEVKKYGRKGKPAAGNEATLVGYTIDLVLERNEEAVSKLLNKTDFGGFGQSSIFAMDMVPLSQSFCALKMRTKK